VKVYKDKQFLVFDFENGKTVKYDFATKKAIGIKGKPVKDLRSQLRGISMSQIIENCEDEKYAKFLSFVMRSESIQHYEIWNVGTVLDRVPSYSRFEQLFSAGIDDIIESKNKRAFKYSINDIPKSLLKLCREHSIKLTNDIVRFYKENPNAYCIAYKLDYISLDYYDIYKIWKTSENIYDANAKSYFNILVNEYGYNAKDLWLYIDRIKTFEAIEDMAFLIRELCDYADMMRQLSNKYDKYPRHFLTTHKIACRNYDRMKKEFSEELFRKRMKKEYECSFGEYVFIYPKSTQEIKDEAARQSNCVSSYIDKVIDGYCHILFLRKKNSPKESLVTIEVRNDQIVQAKRRFNDDVTEEQKEVIDKFNKKFGKEIKAA
jgi:hypothetical protein